MTPVQRVRIVAAVILVALFVVWWTVLRSPDDGGDALMASGTVETVQADLGFTRAGLIAAIAVREGDSVAAGAELARLDRSELTAQRMAAAAQLASHQAVLAELRTGARSEEIAEARAAVRAALRRKTEAETELARTRRLFDGGAVSQSTLDRHETAFEVAEADYTQATERLQIVETGPRRERVDAQAAAVRQAEAALAQIDAALQHTTIRAPFDGLVTLRHREPGEIVAPGAAVLTLMNPAERWVRIYLRQDVVGRVSLGDDASITSDSYPDREYRGTVSYIASDAEFTPRNVQTTEERVKLVFEVWVRITEDPSFDLKPGLAADVTLHVASP